MKKILSLLSMLMITVTAFATDYTDQLTFKLTVGSNSSEKSLPQGTLTIEKRVDGTYNVTASGCDFSAADFGNWGDISCDGVAGTTNADGLTTIEVSKPEVFANGSVPSGYSLSGQSLLVKFNGTKAYALLKGKLALNAIVGYPFEYTFGTDEGFDGGGSTGGGETGGETSSIVTVKENFQSTEGSSWGENVTIDWNTQKLVASINLASTGSDKGFLGVTKKGQTAGWNNYGIIFYNTNGSTVQGYAPGQPNNANTDQVTKGEDPVRFEISKDGGVKCQGNVVISASNIAHLTNQSEIVVGAADKPAGALYNYIKVVPLNWTEVPPVTVKDTKKFENVAYTTSMGGSGTATVTFNEMSDGTFPMTFVSDDLNVKAENLTKDTDAKGRTTYTGTAKRTDADVTFTVKAVVYTEGTEEKLYMTMDNGSSLVVTVGEDPDAPKVVATVPFTGVTLSASNGVTGTADVTFKEMSDETVQMTFNGAGYGISATNLTKGTDAKGRTTYTGQAVNDAASTVTYTVKAVVYTEGAEKKLYMTMVSVDGTTFTVGEDPDYVAPEPEIEGTVVEGSKNYAANGSKFEWSNIAINWNKQKLVAVIDLSSCTGTSENILSVGQNIGSWSIGGWHFYYTVASKKMKSDYLATDGAHPVSDPKTGVEPGTVRIELSKAEGCTIDGVSYNALYDSSVTGTWQSNTEDFWNLTSVNIGSKEGANRSNAVIKYVTVVDLPVTVKDEKTFNEALYMQDQKVADATVVVKEMSDETINMSLKFGENEYTSTELTKGTDTKGRTTYTGKVANGTQTYDVAGVVYEKDNVARLYMTLKTSITTVVVGENPDVVTPEVTEVSNKTYTSNLRILDGETTVVEEAEANVNIIKYSDDSYKVTLKNVNMLNKTQDLVFVGKVITDVTDSEAPLTIMAKSDEATTKVFGEQVSGTFEITEVSAEEIKMGFSMESQNFSYQGEFNYTEEEEPEVYTSNLHIYDAAAPETDLFQADQAKVEFLATETGEFKLTLKDVTLNEKTQDLVFTGALPTPQPGGQDPLAEEGETTPAEPAMVLNATADEATATFLGATSATAVFNVSYDKNDNFMMTFTIAAGAKNYGGEFNYEKKNPDTPDPELFSKENYVADGEGFEWEIAVDWDTQKIVMSIDPSTCTGSCEDVIGLGAVPTAWDNTLHLYRTSADQMLQGYFNVPGGSNNNTDKFAETAPFLVEVSKAQGFVVNNEVKIAASAMSYLFTLPTVKMGTGEGANDKSRATYNYVKVVDKDWTAPKDPDTGINATTVAEGEVEFFTVNGVKLNKLQKGLNIVRTADGKVKKVLVK
ncbi:hypothetical protein [Leyella stercorea]|uniref:hypothetical protein n=1 Tax=Leyella stercorea TaxID=363265 RepID=UPI0024328B72|nr:hypothetical protein [Leyella stercorea]